MNYYDNEEEFVEEVVPYYEDEDDEDGGFVEVNDDAYWDVYFTPVVDVVD